MAGDLEIRLKYKKDDDDDWTKVEDKALRKKLQNRLAKRKSRVDNKKAKTVSNSSVDGAGPRRSNPESSELRKITISGNPASLLAIVSSPTAPDPFRVENSIFSTPASIETENSSALVKNTTSANLSASLLTTYISLPGLTEHHHLPLPQYTLLRAFVANANLLKFDLIAFADDDALSPFCSMRTGIQQSLETTEMSILANTTPHIPPAKGKYPHTLAPTALQKRTPHHPYLDIIAPPSMRDGVLLANLTDEQEDELCISLHTDSFVVWGGQPWNALAWEVSQGFLDRWGWLLDEDVISASNFWRAERGEEGLKLPSWHVLSVGR